MLQFDHFYSAADLLIHLHSSHDHVAPHTPRPAKNGTMYNKMSENERS